MTHAAPDDQGDVPVALRGLLDLLPVEAAAKRKLGALMEGAKRFYHNANHLRLLWDRHCEFGEEAGMREPAIDRLVACAIAYHDAIYETGRRDNEERSAALWMEVSKGSTLSFEERRWVAETIHATADHLGYAPKADDAALPIEERARLWVLDLDLTPLGEEWSEFEANTERLRAEDAGRTGAEAGRLRFLAHIAAHPRIYRTPVIARRFESAARRNLSRALVAGTRRLGEQPVVRS